MIRARVRGRATATVKHPTLEGWRLLLVQPLMADGTTADGDPVLAVDATGAGHSDIVILTSDGRATRELIGDDTTPARWSVVGIEN